MRSFLPGKRLPEKVVEQIQKRQDVLGLTGDRFSETGPSSYAYYNQKTPWIRVISSVNIKNNDTQARINVLSNGVLENHNSNTPAGYEISPTLGPRPKPGITSMDLRTHNRFGSLRTATVNFTVFSIEDLNIYERLYMSPGYTALLEWGHSKALNSDGEVEDVQPLDLEEVFEEGLTMSKVFTKIQEQRRKYSYNYDASFGLVKNFSWSLSSDGSYECSMDIVSIGTAFESMNISPIVFKKEQARQLTDREKVENQQLERRLEPQDETALTIPGTSQAETDAILSNVDTESITPISETDFPQPVEDINAVEQAEEQARTGDFTDEQLTLLHIFIDTLLIDTQVDTTGNSETNFYKEYRSSNSVDVAEKLFERLPIEERTRRKNTFYEYQTVASKYLTVNSKENPELKDQKYSYIQLGAFLEILNYFIPADQENTPLFQFDTSVLDRDVRDYRTLDNFHCSVDASKCLLPRTETKTNSSDARQVVNNITGILLEKKYLYETINSNLSQGQVRIYDLIQTILEDVVRVTGRVNDLQLQYYENFRTFRIVDRNFTDVEEEYPSISIFGKNSFTKQVNLASRLTPEISTMLAIAAQAAPVSNGIEGTAFREFSKNQTDRIIEIRQDPEIKKRNLSELQEQFASVFEYLFIVYGQDQNRVDVGAFAESVQKLGILPPNVISDYVDFCNYQIYGESLGEEPKANNFIIPYELNLTVDGISGLEVMSAFVTDDTLIPDRYGRNGDIGFLITGLQHRVSPQGWDTMITSQIFNLDKGKRKSNEGKFNLPETSTKRSLPTVSAFIGPVPNADRLRSTLSTLNYTEKVIPNYKYGEISSGGDLESTFTNSLIKFFTELKSQFGESLSIRVTGGNDVYHQNKKTGDHPIGKGLDFTIQPYTTDNSEKIRNIARNNNLNFLDEYQKRTANQTGAHIHIYG